MERQHAFTIFDLMMSLAIVGILLGFGVPGLEHLLARQASDATAHVIWRTLAKTRETAVLSGRETSFCGIDNNNQCERDNIQTLIIFHDGNRDHKLDGSDRLISRIPLDYPGTVTLRASNQHYISYAHNGDSKQFGSLVLCHASKEPQYIRRVTVNRSGRHYLARDYDGDGVIKGAGGETIHCD